MFGYVVANKPELKLREFAQYKSYYCGLCHMLRRKYGLSAGFTLTYDMTFLIMLLGSLYEPRTQTVKKHCPIHPIKKVSMVETTVTEYAADMNILLAGNNLRDDWEDEKKIYALAGEKIFSRRVAYVEEKYPRQAMAVGEALKQLGRMEKDYMKRWSESDPKVWDDSAWLSSMELSSTELDRIARPFSEMLGEIFVMREDAFAPILKNIGFYLGKYIYIKDALDDLEKDKKNKSFNPFLYSRMTQEYRQWIEQWQETTLRACIAEFEKLPLERDITILRNILYEGVKIDKSKDIQR